MPVPALRFDHLQPTTQAVWSLWPDAASGFVIQCRRSATYRETFADRTTAAKTVAGEIFQIGDLTVERLLD